jgi:hypothetical protein
MNRNLASVLTLATATAAVACAAAIASSNAYADDITVDKAPFVSTKTRAEVRAELMGQSEALRIASSEWGMQHNQGPQVKSTYTTQQAKAEYIAARDEVKALTSEDSGSSYFARRPIRMNSGTMMAGPAR